MGTVDVYNISREKVGEVELADEIFFAPVREHLFWEVVKWQQACRRSGTANTKTRGSVAGSTRKLYRQKGTGRARRGDIKSPLLRGGGVVFGPHPRDFSYKLPKKVRKAALIAALSQRCKENRLVVVDRMDLPEVKTRRMVEFLEKFEIENALIVDQKNRHLYLSARNIPNVKVLPVEGLNVFDILKHDTLILTRQAVAGIEGRLKK